MKDQELIEIIFSHYKEGKFKLMAKGISQYGKEFFTDLFWFLQEKYKKHSTSYRRYYIESIHYWVNKYSWLYDQQGRL